MPCHVTMTDDPAVHSVHICLHRVFADMFRGLPETSFESAYMPN